jgi:hypothetical protein
LSFADVVKKTIERSIREAGLVNEPPHWIPPPTDLDAEGEVLSARINGHVLAIELAPLDAHHFYALINQEVWKAAAEVPPGDLVGLQRALVTRGWRGAITNEVMTLAAAQPFCNLRRLREHADRLIDLWRRRALIDIGASIELELRRGTITALEARQRYGARSAELFAAPLKVVGE